MRLPEKLGYKLPIRLLVTSKAIMAYFTFTFFKAKCVCILESKWGPLSLVESPFLL